MPQRHTKLRPVWVALLGTVLIAVTGALALTQPELPADPLCDLIRIWQERGIYQKALIDEEPALEGTVLTSLDRQTIADQIKATCQAYQLAYWNSNEADDDSLITLIRVKDGDLARSFILLGTPGGYTMVKFSFEERSDPDLTSIVDLLPELRQIGDQIEFKKENFVDNSHSALLLIEARSTPELADENARSVLLDAGWQQMFKNGDPRLADVFTKGRFNLQLQVQADGQETTSITCTILERKAGRVVSDVK